MTEFTEELKIVIVGHVDHGKSTLVGRLLFDSGSLPEGKWTELQRVAERRHMPFEWANLVDALQAERNQNITIETTQIRFRQGLRQYVLIDAPGHKEFLKNMVTGAAQAHAALLLIDANEGVKDESRRHAYLLELLGIRDIVVLINKMDLQDYQREVFQRIQNQYESFLSSLGLTARCYIPISARHGDNLVSRSHEMSWWAGPTLRDVLLQFQAPPPPDTQPLRFVVQDVYRFDHRRVIAGRVESGSLKIGDRLLFRPGFKAGTVRTIERWQAPPSQSACPGESIGLTLTHPIFVERGHIATLESSPPYELPRFKARVFWMGHHPLSSGKNYKLRLATQEVDCTLENLVKVIDASSLKNLPRPGPDVFVQRHEVAELYLRTRQPLVFDAYSEIIPTGRFVLQDGLDIAGGGIILTDDYPRQSLDGSRMHRHLYWRAESVTAQQREQRNAQAGCVLWLTGLSGSGKSTIANELVRWLFDRGLQAYLLDGDKLRHGLCSDLGFSLEDRKENIRRVGEVAKLFADAGLICITALISPYRADRARARSLVQAGRFFEIYVNAPLAVCEQRDPKGLYAKARAGQLKEFTGISAPYEAPLVPELELRTDQLTVPEAVQNLMHFLKSRGIFGDKA